MQSVTPRPRADEASRPRLALCAGWLAALMVAACGGGSGGAVQTGQTQDVMAGLGYETSSGLKGTTDAQGRFNWRSGDSISFKIGDLLLGRTQATAAMGVVDMVGANAPVASTSASATSASASDARVLNLLRLLHALDEDRNPANGITIPAAARSALVGTPTAALNPQTLSTADLQTRILDVVFGAGTRSLGSESAALNNALAVEAKRVIAAMPGVTNYVIGGGIVNCSSFNGDRQSSNCGADWNTILAQDPAFAGLSKANISFDSNYVRPTLTYSITQANIDRLSALSSTVVRTVALGTLTSTLSARLVDTSKPRNGLSWSDFDAGKAEYANGKALWDTDLASEDFDFMVNALCGTVSPSTTAPCALSDSGIASIESASFASATNRAKTVFVLRHLQTTLGINSIPFRSGSPNLRSSFRAVTLAADGTAPVLGLGAGLNTTELSALREVFVDPVNNAARKIEARSVQFLSNAESRDIYMGFVAAARQLAGGNTPHIGVLTSATGAPWGDRDLNVTALQSAGARVIYIPMDGGVRKALDENNNCLHAAIYSTAYSNTNASATTYHADQVYPEIATLRNTLCANNAAELNNTLRSLHGLFLAGGDQARHLETFVTKDGTGRYTQVSPQLQILRERYNAGQLVVSGTSAGAAIQSGGTWKGKSVPMLGGGDSWNVLKSGYVAGTGPTASEGVDGLIYADGGMGFFRYGVIDQHFSQRTREGRLVRATREQGLDYGFGVDENTALVVGKPDANGTTRMTVIGAGGVYVADVRAATANGTTTSTYRISGITTHYISAGDYLEINAAGELRVVLAASKPVVTLNASAPRVTNTQVQEYGSSNYLKLTQSMGSTGAAQAWGTTETSSGQSNPAYSVLLTRNAQTVFRVQGHRISYTNVIAAFDSCGGPSCTAPSP